MIDYTTIGIQPETKELLHRLKFEFKNIKTDDQTIRFLIAFYQRNKKVMKHDNKI